MKRHRHHRFKVPKKWERDILDNLTKHLHYPIDPRPRYLIDKEIHHFSKEVSLDAG